MDDDDNNLPAIPDPSQDPQFVATLEALKDAATALEPKARRDCGLYMQDANVAMTPPMAPGEEPQVVLMMNFIIGDQAFSDRVQNPLKADTEMEFRKMATSLTEDEFNDLRNKLKSDLGVQEDEDEGRSSH